MHTYRNAVERIIIAKVLSKRLTFNTFYKKMNKSETSKYLQLNLSKSPPRSNIKSHQIFML